MSKIQTLESVLSKLHAYADVIVSGLKGRGWKEDDELPFGTIVNCYCMDIPAYRCAIIIHKLKVQKETEDESD